MSQITRCPACATTFKVVADQLRISDGWVRCGQCKEVFHAASNLLEMPAPHPVPAPVADASPAAETSGLEPGLVQPLAPEPPVPEPLASPAADPAPAPAVEPAIASRNVADVWSSPRQAAASTLQVPSPQDEDDDEGEEALTASFGDDALPSHATSSAPAVAEPYLERESAPDSGGYELPFAELRDSGWPDDIEGLEDGTQSDEGDASRDEAAAQDSGDEDADLASAPEGGEASWAADPLDAMVGLEAHAIAEAGPAPAVSSSPEVPGGLLRKADESIEHEALPEFSAGDRGWEAQGPNSFRNAERGGEAQTAFSRGAFSATNAEEPGFVRAARRQAFWQSRTVQAVLAVASLLLLAGLVVQVAWRERDLIAAQHPAMRPALQAVCRALGCEVAPLRRIADVVIDGSSFAKAREGGFQLQLTLKNRGSTVLAMPAVELTLTDAKDQPVVRRVLRPDEVGAPETLPSQGEWSGTVPLGVSAGADRVTGYRVLAFYP